MESTTLQRRCIALQALLPPQTATAQRNAPAAAAAHLRNAPPPTPLLKQTTPLSSEQCAVLTDWIARVAVQPQQTVASNDALPALAAAGVPSAASSSLPDVALCTHVLRLFRPLLSAVLARICNDAAHLANLPSYLHVASLLAHAACICPHALPTITGWFRTAPFSLLSCLGAQGAASAAETEATVAFTALRLLQLDPQTFCTLWDWAPFMALLQSPAPFTRWLAARSVAIVQRMNEHDKTSFLRQTMLANGSSAEAADHAEQAAKQLFEQYLSSVHLEQALVWMDAKEQDARTMTPETEANDAAAKGAIDLTPGSSLGAAAPAASPSDMDKQLQSHMVSLGGVLLPKRARRISPADAATASAAALVDAQQSPLIHVPSTAKHLRSIALSLCERRPVLLEGPSGCGKTVLIDECARLCGHFDDLVRLHLDDQMDSKTLLGNYACTDVPGEFRWVAGALTQAVAQGRWVLIEDIDRCPFEILSAIISLLERRTLYLAGRGDTIVAAEGFQLFATRTTTGVAGAPAPTTEATPLLHALFSRVHVSALTREELLHILAQRLGPRFASKKLMAQILATFHAFVPLPSSASADEAVAPSPFASSAALGSSRKYSTRDLLKWLTRIEIVLRAAGFDVKSSEHITAHMNEQIFLSAVEVFASPIPPPVRPLTAAAAAASTSATAAAIAGGASSAAAASATASVIGAGLTPRQQVVAYLASLWQIDPARAQYFAQMYKPRLEVTPSSLSIGRVTLSRFVAGAQSAMAEAQPTFAFTKYHLSLLEHMAACVLLREPMLLVSDTGTGKTTTIQMLAHLCGRRLHVQNLNQQSDSADLIGGFKPTEIGKLMVPLMNQFGALFPRTFSRAQNADFLAKLRRKYDEKAWNTLIKMMRQSVESAEKKLAGTESAPATATAAGAAAAPAAAADTPRKQAKTTPSSAPSLLSQWRSFSSALTHLQHQLSQLRSAFVFHFHEGALVTALRQGDWILLDELNLASSETLERLSGILESASSSLSLTERGDASALERHPEFRLFGAMNPGADAGKKHLPPSIRARFTELFVEEMHDRDDLMAVVKQYLEPKSKDGEPTDYECTVPYEGIVNFYLHARALAASGAVQEGSNNSPAASNAKPHYSLRTLCRALQYARTVITSHSYSFQRALFEGCSMSFCTLLTPDSARRMHDVLLSCLGFTLASLGLDAAPKKPAAALQGVPHVLVGGSYFLPLGDQEVSDALTAKFIVTATVSARLKLLSRAILTGKYPVLIQGTTSAGKTSLVEYLALKTGHKFVRINNHEHTDLAEYMGSYVTDPRTGKLVFQEGVLVQAVRKGHWIVLDELNLAPSEVLEALNRLLDDNRELFLPETQETIRPHPHFLLFATQNPAGGVYAGRKVLSKAFRNRFVTLHVDDLPEAEVEIILQQRCTLPPSYAKAMIGTMKALQQRREQHNVFAGKHSFMTPRDLFRWGERAPSSYQQLAEDGFMLFGERLRTDDAKRVVKEVLEQHCKAKIDEQVLYSQQAVDKLVQHLTEAMRPADAAAAGGGPSTTALLDPTSAANASNAEAAAIGKIAWTFNMRRLFVQLGRALQFQEPVLTVGETGCGKCWGAGTQLMLFDGRSMAVDDIVKAMARGETVELMGDDGTVRRTLPGTQTVGNTKNDKPTPAVMMPLKAHLQRWNGGFHCKYDGCDFVSSSRSSCRAHESDAALHTLVPASDPATYRITSLDASRASWTCNEAHILVLKFVVRPTAVEAMEENSYAFSTLEVMGGKQAEDGVWSGGVAQMLPQNFACRADAEAARAEVVKSWRPLVWECTVEDFLRCDKTLQHKARMFQPEQVVFPSTGKSLQQRLEAALLAAHPTADRTEIDALLTPSNVQLTARVIGLWMAHGARNSATVLHTDAAVVTMLVEWHDVVMRRDSQPADVVSHPQVQCRTSRSGESVFSVRMGPVLRRLLKAYEMLVTKQVPHSLLTDSVEVRTQLMAGILSGSTGSTDVREVTTRHRRFADALVHLARGLGFSAGVVAKSQNLAVQIRSSSSEEEDPCCSGFTVQKVSHAAYFGFQLSGNGRCLMGDFVVTHNTTVCQLFSLVLQQNLRVINCHAHTESSDFLGGLRPVRGKEKTLADLREQVSRWMETYQRAQASAHNQAASSEQAVADAADVAMETDEPASEGASASSLPPLSEAALALLSTPSSLDTLTVPELMRLFHESADVVASLDKAFQAARRKHEAGLAELAQAKAERAAQRKGKKYKKGAAGAAAAAADVDMDDASLPVVPSAPAPLPLPQEQWSELVSLSSGVRALSARYSSLFEWVDGALVSSMRTEELLLIDEISLAEDAVLERLNSVLEPSRTLFLAEKGGTDAEVIRAGARWRLFATMNPGGDFGKKELSPALRNRFTEVWVPPFSDKQDLLQIITSRMAHASMHPYADSILEFVQWFNRNNKPAVAMAAAAANTSAASASAAAKSAAGPSTGGSKRYLSLRDVLSWVSFMNQCLKLGGGAGASDPSRSMSAMQAYLHGSCLTVLDGLGIGSTDSEHSIQLLKRLCIEKLLAVLPEADLQDLSSQAGQLDRMQAQLLNPSAAGDVIVSSESEFGIAPFVVRRGPLPRARKLAYALEASTTQTNLMRVLRALSLPKAVLLEGPPGVGKTSLLTTLAAAAGHPIVRINLSEQTDMMDLLGMDLPVTGGRGGEFRWCDGIFLQALKAGHWVLLDELNLASQSVLEGLNAVLDHRAQVFIPELDRTFACPPSFRIFACQNPMSQGGGRKGLPASFLNRFTKVYLHALSTQDMFFITRSLNPTFPPILLRRALAFNARVHEETMVTRRIGRKGFPFEFNLRDVFKLCELMQREHQRPALLAAGNATDSDDTASSDAPNPARWVDLVYLQRMRTVEDRRQVAALYHEVFSAPLSAEERAEGADEAMLQAVSNMIVEEYPAFRLTEHFVQVGGAFLPRRTDVSDSASKAMSQQPLLPLQQLLRPLHHLATCIQHNFPVLLLGESGTAKTSLVRLLSSLTHNVLHEILMTSGIDSSELLGCFEQVDLTRHKKQLLSKTKQLLDIVLAKCLSTVSPSAIDAAMSDSAQESAVASKPTKASKRQRDGNLTPTDAAAASVASLTLQSPAGMAAASMAQRVGQLLHTWSMLDTSSSRGVAANSTSMLAQAEAAESVQQLSTAAFSSEQYTLLRSLLSSLSKLLPSLSASFAVPSHLSPDLLLQQAAHIQDLASSTDGKVIGNFEWLDGSLLNALELGEWVLLDNVNFTNATVLDRLNPLLETDGVLLVNECGLVNGAARVIRPHPNFRLILAMDPRYGEISRAMRNRCVEICLTSPVGVQSDLAAVSKTAPSGGAKNTAVSPSVHDLLSVVNSLGIKGLRLPEFLVSVHAFLCRMGSGAAEHKVPGASSSTIATLKALTVRNLKHWCLLVAQQVEVGAAGSNDGTATAASSSGLASSLWITFQHAYNLSASSAGDAFAAQLQQTFDRQYRKIVLQQGAAASSSSLLAPTLWPSLAPSFQEQPTPRERHLEIQGATLRYLASLALSQAVDPARDQHVLGMLRALLSQQAGKQGGAVAFLPDQAWQFVYGLAAQPPTVNAVKLVKDEPGTVASAVTSAVTQSSGLPQSSLTPVFSSSADLSQAQPTVLYLFHLSLLAFVESTGVREQDQREQRQWLQRQLLEQIALFEQQQPSRSSSSASAAAPVSTPAIDAVVTDLRSEVDLALRCMEVLLAHPLVRSYMRNMDALIARCGLSAEVLAPSINPFADATFVPLLRTHARGDSTLMLEQVLAQWEVVRLLLQSVYQAQIEERLFAAVPLGLSNPAQLSLLELSSAAYANLLTSARLASLVSSSMAAQQGAGLSAELIAQLHPFWTALQGLERNLLEHAFELAATSREQAAVDQFQQSLAQLVQHKNFFWRSLQDTKGVLSSSGGSVAAAHGLLDQIHVRWKGLNKRLRAVVALVPGLENAGKASNPHQPAASAARASGASASALQSSYVTFQALFTTLQGTLQGTTHASTSLVGVKNTLWKRGGHPLLPRDRALQQLEMQLQEIEQRILYRPTEVPSFEGESSTSRASAPPSNKGTAPFFVVDQRFKDVLLDAFVSLRFLFLQQGSSGWASRAEDADAEESEAAAVREQKELLSALSSVPGMLHAKLQAALSADQAQLDSMRFHVQIVGEGEESLEDLGVVSKSESDGAVADAPMRSEHEAVEEDDDAAGRPSAQFLSVSADAAVGQQSSRFSEQSSHKKSYILPLLLPIFDLSYLGQAPTVLAHVDYVGFAMQRVRRELSKKAEAVDAASLHSLLASLQSALSSLLSFLPSLLSFYTSKSSALSGLLDVQALKLVELLAGSVRTELQAAVADTDSSALVAPAAAASDAIAFVRRVSSKVVELCAHWPALVQSVKYHYANFLSRFLSAHAPSLRNSRVVTTSTGEPDASVLHSPVKSLLVVSLISQSVNISLIHRHAKRIQLQLLGEHLARDLVRTPRVSRRDRQATGLVLRDAASRSTAQRSLHARMLECVSLLSAFHAVLVCFDDMFAVTADFERAERFVAAMVLAALEQAGGSERSPAQVPSSLPAEVQQSLQRVRDPRLLSLLQSLVVPFLQSLLSLLSSGSSTTAEQTAFALSHASLHLSLLQFYLLLPVSPVDSNQKFSVLLRDESVQAAANRVDLERAVWEQSLASGRTISHAIARMQKRALEHAVNVQQLQRQVTYRRHDPERTKPFHVLFHEFHRFARTFLDLGKLRAQFVQPMTPGAAAAANGDAAQRRLEEELEAFQSNAQEFIARMQSSFSEYPDFTVPLLTALFGAKQALSDMHHAYVERLAAEQSDAASDKQRAVYQTVRALVCFPFGNVSADATALASHAPAAETVSTGESAPGVIPPLELLTLPPVLAEIDSLCRSAVSLIKEEAALRREERRAAAEASGDVDIDTVANELVEAGALRSNTSAFYSIRLSILSIVLARVLLLTRVSGRLTPGLLSILDQLFRSFILIYQANRERVAAKEAAEKALFKFKEQKEVALTEEEKDKAALALLFPDYSDDFKDILNANGEDDVPLMDEEVEASQRRQREAKEAEQARADAKQDANDEFGILHLTPDHLSTIYNTFVAIFSIQKSSAAVVSAAQTASTTFTDAEAITYAQAYASAYDVGSTLLQALSMQGLLSTRAVIPSPSTFESELQAGHLFVLCQSLHKLHLSGGTADGTGRDEVTAIMESFMNEEGSSGSLAEDAEQARQQAIALHHGPDSDKVVAKVDVTQLDEGFKFDGKTGTKASSGLLAQSEAASAKAVSKIDWSKFPDVYHEPNILEYRKLERPLTLLMLRLRQLLNQFAQHPILMQLLQLAHRVLNLSSNTPLMKLLTGLELLLKKAEEWESYAARHVSLKKELVELGILVARWRKMELYTWPKALASKEAAFHQQALQGWFQLYGLVHTSDEGVARTFPPDAFPTQAATEDAFVQQLYEALDEFIITSSLGQLKTRMSIVLGFYQQMHLEIVEGFTGNADAKEDGQAASSASAASSGSAHRTPRMRLALRERISRLLLNLYQYYEQFLPWVDELVRRKKAPLEKQLREQVRLAKWDLSNFWSLKESAEKSHRKLHKFSKEYEEILLLPFRAIIAKEDERDAAEGDDTVPFGRAGQEVAEARQALARLEKHLQKQKDKAAKKREKARAAAAKAGQEFQEEEEAEAEDAAFAAEAEALPSLAESLTIVLPDAEQYRSDREKWDAWFVLPSEEAAGDDAAMDASVSAPARATPSVRSYQTRLPGVFHKMQSLSLRGPLSASYTTTRQSGRQDVESFSVHLISRVQRLTLPETKFSYKKKAFGDVVKALREMGLTHHMRALMTGGEVAQIAAAAAATPVPQSSADAIRAQAASIPALFLQSPLTSVFLKSSAHLPLSTSEGYEFLRALSKQCESYMYRVWGSVRKMRGRAVQAHKDITAVESARAKGMVEHAFHMLCTQRAQVSLMAQRYHTLGKWSEWIQSLDVDDSSALVKSEESAAAPSAAVSFPTWSARFWTHKHLLDSLFSAAKYTQLLYARMQDDMLSGDGAASAALKTQLLDAQTRVRSVLAALSSAKIEMDRKVASLFPNLQLTSTRAGPNAVAVSGPSAAESVLELNDQPNAAFLLANIQRVLAVVTEPLPAPVSADGSAIDLSSSEDEDGSIIELPFVASTSSFNELVVALVRSKHEIREQAHAATTGVLSAVPAEAASDAEEQNAASLSRAFQSSYHSLVSSLQLSVQASFKHVQAQADLAARRARIASGEEAEAPATGPNALPDEKSLLDEVQVAENGLAALQLQPINDHLHRLTDLLNRLKRCRASDATAEASYRSFRTALHNIVPLLDQVSLLSERAMASSLTLHRSLLKLVHILLSIFNKILARGFCRRPDEPEDEGDSAEGPPEEKEGTGMGEGEGNKDVSNQITDEEQLLGTKDPLEDEAEKEKNPEAPPEPQQPDTEEGLEMEGDFDGDMHDVPKDDGEEDPNDDKKDDGKEELDREMGDLGDQQDVVDEKLWDESDDDSQMDEDEKQKKRQEEKYERDAAISGANPDEDEIAAKDEQEQQADDKQKPKDKPKPGDEEEEAKAPEEERPEPQPAEDDGQKPVDSDDEGEEDQPPGMVNEDRDDKYEDKHDVDPMSNVPDDLALDEDKQDEEEGKQEADGADEDEQMDDANKGAEEEPEPAKDGEEKMEDDGKEGGEELEDDERNREDPDAAPEDKEPDAPEEAANTVEAAQQPAAEEPPKPDAPEDEEQEPDPERPDHHADPDQKDTNQGAHRVAGGEQGRQGGQEELEAPDKDNKKAAPLEQDEEEKQDSAQKGQEDQSLDQANANDAAEGTESEWQPQAAQSRASQQPDTNAPKKKKKPPPRQAPNPFKSLGDATKKWQERLRILDSDESKEDDAEQTQLENEGDADEGDDEQAELEGTVENVSEKQKADAQMLGPVEQKLDSKDLPKLAQPEEQPQQPEEQAKPEEEEEPMHDQTEPDAPNPDAQDDAKPKTKDSRRRGGAAPLQPSRLQEDEDEAKDDEEMADAEEQPAFDPFANESKDGAEDEEVVDSRIGAMSDLASAAAANPAADPNDPAHAEWLQSIRDELDTALQSWDSAASGDRQAHAQDLWSKFTDLTSDLSASLCESLRAILEPLVATKLQGDYKTGKRISLKKIIPYIASSFRKDKIWLKRTKPNKRRYQVMLAIDDSHSMRNHGAGRLALEAMTVLTKALTALEVGELALVSFGSQVQLLHPFTRPFTDAAGAFALGHFQFQQQLTRWPDLLERTVSILDEAKSIGGGGSGGEQHHQLVFVISDARVQQDREVVARWTREALSKNQLLVLIIVEGGDAKDSIQNTKTVSYPNGKIKIADYLDEFPFPYYILLRDIQSLPEIVADALRQWFELIRVAA